MNENSWLSEVTLESELVKLVPLKKEHAKGLVAAASDGNLWELWYTYVPRPDTVESYIDEALKEKEQGKGLPFAIIDKGVNEIIGSTRFCHADTENHRVEIGYTWYAKSYQRSLVNTKCKLLLLTHAFEQLDAIAVEFRTHWHNLKSRTAISRIGAKQDGILRNHSKTDDGCYRDTVVFSIIDLEWPTVKKGLLLKAKVN